MKTRWRRRRSYAWTSRIAIRSRKPWWWTVLLLFGLALSVLGAGAWTFNRLAYRDVAATDPTQLIEQANRLKQELEQLRAERDAQAVRVQQALSELEMANAARDRFAAQMKALEQENATLEDDLAFFERIAPASASGVAIRKAVFLKEATRTGAYRYRVLVSQGPRAKEFLGRLELAFIVDRGVKGDATIVVPNENSVDRTAFALSFRTFQRLDGSVYLPADATLKSIDVRVFEGNTLRAHVNAMPDA